MATFKPMRAWDIKTNSEMKHCFIWPYSQSQALHFFECFASLISNCLIPVVLTRRCMAFYVGVFYVCHLASQKKTIEAIQYKLASELTKAFCRFIMLEGRRTEH